MSVAVENETASLRSSVSSTCILPAPQPSTFNPQPCPLCHGRSVERFEKHGVAIRDCESCGHRFALPPEPETHVAEVYGDDYFHGGGAGYSDYLSEAALLRAHGRHYAKLLSRFMPQPGTLFDVGAAAGFLLQGFCDGGWRGQGLEPNAAMARHAREQLGLNVVASSLEEYSSMRAGERDGVSPPMNDEFKNAALTGGLTPPCSPETHRPFDVVSLIQVMAHFVDPQVALQRVSELLRPGGLCLVETWNVRSWTARLFGQQWHEYSPPSVLHWFSPKTLRRLFESAGFQQVAIGRPRKWLNVGHAKSLLRHKLTNRVARAGMDWTLGLVPDRWHVPYPSEDLFWALFQLRS